MRASFRRARHVQNRKRDRPFFAQFFGRGRCISDHPFFIGDPGANAGNGKRTATLSDDLLRGTRASYPPIMYDIEGARQARARNIAIQISERAPHAVRQNARILAMPGLYQARSVALAVALP